MAVVLYHLPTMGLNGQALYGPLATLVDQGWLGVDLFFTLSGFVLALVHQQDFAQKMDWAGVKRFWQFRFARVYPLHFVLLLVYGAVIGLQTLLIKPIDYPGLTWLEFMGALFLAQIWMPIHSAFNAPSWSISAEALAYLCFPIIAFCTARLKKWGSNGLLLAALLGAFALWPWGHWVLLWQQSPGTPVHSLDAIVRIALEFSMGCVLYNLCKPAMNLPAEKRYIFDGIGLVLMGLLPLGLVFGLSPVMAEAWFLALLACLALPGKWLNLLLGNKKMVYFGEISYAIYLCHMLVMMVLAPIFRRLPVNSVIQWAVALPYLVLVIWLGHLLYTTVETPCRIGLRNWFKSTTSLKINKISPLKPA